MRYRAADLARLGEGARRQIANFRFAQAAQVDQLAGEKPKRSKYGAEKTTVYGRTFDSKAEANRFLELRHLHRTGAISGLICQPVFAVEINGVHICNYIADFEYIDGSGHRVIEDTKSTPTKTPVYRLKKKLVECLHGVRIVEVT